MVIALESSVLEKARFRFLHTGSRCAADMNLFVNICAAESGCFGEMVVSPSSWVVEIHRNILTG